MTTRTVSVTLPEDGEQHGGADKMITRFIRRWIFGIPPAPSRTETAIYERGYVAGWAAAEKVAAMREEVS